jgi:hypothetical protein
MNSSKSRAECRRLVGGCDQLETRLQGETSSVVFVSFFPENFALLDIRLIMEISPPSPNEQKPSPVDRTIKSCALRRLLHTFFYLSPKNLFNQIHHEIRKSQLTFNFSNFFKSPKIQLKFFKNFKKFKFL